ncbi:MAG: septal ring lytic transglycosylase RlpA family protein [bacterium]|nr:septal ring lytic transglycosylase RlpA family protein [bacterium]
MWWMVICLIAAFFMMNAGSDPSQSSRLGTAPKSIVAEDTFPTDGKRYKPDQGRSTTRPPLRNNNPPDRKTRVADWYDVNPEYAPRNFRRQRQKLIPQRVVIDKAKPFKVEGWALASWYGPGFEGKPTAWGKPFKKWDETIVAHKSLPRGTKLRLTYPKTGKTIDVTVADRGPYWEDREIDLSQGAAFALGMLDSGVAWLRVERLS